MSRKLAGARSCGPAAYEPEQPPISIAGSEVVPSPNSGSANLCAQMEQAVAHHDGDMRTPRRTISAEQGKIQTRGVIDGGMVEAGIVRK